MSNHNSWYALRPVVHPDPLRPPLLPVDREGWVDITSSRQMAVMYAMGMEEPVIFEVAPSTEPEAHPSVAPYLSEGEVAIIMRTKGVEILASFLPSKEEQDRYFQSMIEVERILSRL